MAKRQLAAQLYTVRDLTAKDFAGTVRQIAKLGYEGVELAGFGNLSAKDAAAAVTDAGLKVCGAHVGIDQLEGNLKGTLKTYGLFGCKNIIVPWMPEDRRKNAAGWKAFGKSLNKAGAILKKEGFQIGYHNHSFEFELVSKGVTGMDLLLSSTDAETVGLELDCFWVVHGGRCPACFIKGYADRIVTLHLKDMSDPKERKFANVGEGILDTQAIIKAGKKARVPWYIVEQDDCYGQSPMEALRVSYQNIRKMDLI